MANTSKSMVQLPPRFALPAVAELLAPLVVVAGRQAPLAVASVGSFMEADRRYVIPRVRIHGTDTGQTPTRLAVFAAIHGDEPATALALVQWLTELAQQPARATGYEIFAYPLVNPTGYEDGTRPNRRGHDLNRKFWSGSTIPEVAILEGELLSQQFDGLIALHADDTSDGLYGYAHGRVLNEALLVPALAAAEAHLPRNPRRLIDGFSARNGVIQDCFPGVLAAPPLQRPQPFEIILETPALAPLESQISATTAALHAILAEYRRFLAYGLNL